MRAVPRVGEARRFTRAEVLVSAAVCLGFLLVLALLYDPLARPERPAPSAGAGVVRPSAGAWPGQRFECANPQVIDGDTLRCGRERVRLASIDAPELPGHCRRGRACVPGDPFASSRRLREFIGRSRVLCEQTDTDVYGRRVAFCAAAGVDLSCAQVRAGAAVIRYGELRCS